MKSLIVVLASSFLFYLVAMASTTEKKVEEPKEKTSTPLKPKSMTACAPRLVEDTVLSNRAETLGELKTTSNELLEDTILLHQAILEGYHVNNQHTISRQP
jgi:hypothetical protein